MKKLGKWDYRVVRFHGNKAEAEKMQMQAMRALGGFLLTCQEHMEICGPWEMKFDDGTIFKLRQNYDIPIIDIFVPEVGVLPPEEVPGRDIEEPVHKKDVFKRENVLSRIVPGYCLVEPKLEYDPYHRECDVDVCASPGWDIFDNHGSNKEVPYVIDEFIEYSISVYREDYSKKVRGLVVVSKKGGGNFQVDYGEETDPVLEDSLIQPGPFPYKGENGLYGGRDYAIAALKAEDTLYVYGGGFFTCENLFSDTWPEGWQNIDGGDHGYSWWSSEPAKLSPQYRFNTSECLEYKYGTCCVLYRSDVYIGVKDKCPRGHLFIEYAIAKNFEIASSSNMQWLMGCWGSLDTCEEVSKSMQIVNNDLSEHGRIRSKTWTTDYTLKSADDEEHEIQVAESEGKEIYTIDAQIFFEGCTSAREDTLARDGVSLHTGSFDGGVVFRSEEEREADEELEENYFCLYVRTIYDCEEHKGYPLWNLFCPYTYGEGTGFPGYRDPDDWDSWRWLPSDFRSGDAEYRAENYPWIVHVGGGIYYDHGVFAHDSKIFTPDGKRGTVRVELVANLNGIEEILDSREYEYGGDHEYDFVVLHSNIFEQSIYMYSYCVIKDTANLSTIKYVRYGYYQGSLETHIRSQMFETAGLQYKIGSKFFDLPYHDVFNSYERLGKYACGLCAAFMIEETREEKFEIETNSWRPVNA